MLGLEIECDGLRWVREMTDVAQFSREQKRFRESWGFLGFAGEVARDGDWIRRDLWGCSVFIQRCGSELRGFENRCAHRFFPLRVKEAGNGPIRCGFHGWRYDEEGRAIGVPMCRELFGCLPSELDARLRPLQIATCGQMIFGRLGDGGETASLTEYLGDMAPILATMSAEAAAPRSFAFRVAANWKIGYHISIEDYHVVAIHPATFGRKGSLAPDRYHYYRHDPHSALMVGPDPGAGALRAMAAACAAGRYQPEDYRVFHIFPNLLISHYRFFGRWYVVAIQYLPLAVDATSVLTWRFPGDFAEAKSRFRRVLDRVVELPRDLFLGYWLRKIVAEDNAVCVIAQQVAHQVTAWPLLGAQEERIGWFEEAYARAMDEAGGDDAMARGTGRAAEAMRRSHAVVTSVADR